MRIPIYTLVLFLLSASAWGQEQTLFSGKLEKSGGFGGPVIKATQINNHEAFLIGGRGGWIINNSLVLGGGGYGVFNDVDAPKDLFVQPATPLDIEFGYGGFEIEYIFNTDALLHYSVYTLIGGGSTNFVKDVGEVTESNEQIGESDFLLVLEPAVTGELNVTNWFRLNAGVSYRLVTGVEQEGLSNSDFSGLTVSLTFKFGRF
jgi:hypothetical protein